MYPNLVEVQSSPETNKNWKNIGTFARTYLWARVQLSVACDGVLLGRET